MNSRHQQTGLCCSFRSLVSFLALRSVIELLLNGLALAWVQAAGIVVTRELHIRWSETIVAL
jgi:hypothetical protein